MQLLVITELFLPPRAAPRSGSPRPTAGRGEGDPHRHGRRARRRRVRRLAPNSVHRLALRRYRWLRPESLLMYLKLLATSLYVAARTASTPCMRDAHCPKADRLADRATRASARLVYVHGEELTAGDKAASSGRCASCSGASIARGGQQRLHATAGAPHGRLYRPVVLISPVSTRRSSAPACRAPTCARASAWVRTPG